MVCVFYVRRGHVDDNVLHVHCIAELLLYPLQEGYTPLHLVAIGGHTTCVEHLLSTPGIVVNNKDIRVSCSIETSPPPPSPPLAM